jgi:hypothetical protein
MVLMAISRKFAPPNHIVVIADPSGYDLPSGLSGSLITSTDSCIIVCCLMSQDGDTEFTLGKAHEVDPGDPPKFHGKLRTPNHLIRIQSVELETILESRVSERETTVRIWTNDIREPDQVIIGIE